MPRNLLIKRIAVLTLVGLFLVGLPLTVAAGSKQMEQSIYVGADEIIDGNFIKAGNVIDINGSVNGDVIVAGNSIRISGAVAGDVIAAGNSITITGPVGGSVRVAGSTVQINGRVEHNVWAVGSTVALGSESSVGWDVYAAGGSVEVRGPLGRRQQLVRALEDHVEASFLQVLARQAEDLGIVDFTVRRMLPFSKHAPGAPTAHPAPPPTPEWVVAATSASANATSLARSTSTTVWMISPYTGSPERTSHPRRSRSRPSPGGGRRSRMRSESRYMPAVTRLPPGSPSCARSAANC